MKYFTKAQIEEIRKALATLGVRDTDLPDVVGLDGSELVAIVQDGENRKVSIRKMIHDYLPDDIAAGADGKSAYDIWREQPGNQNKNVADFLASLKGEKGDKGENGAAGKDGKDGKDGEEYTLPTATASALGGIKVGYSENGNKHPVKVDALGNAYVEVQAGGSGDGDGGDYTLPVADADTLGGVKIGKQANNEQRVYPLMLDSEHRGYVNVPWTGGGGGDSTASRYQEQIFAITQTDSAPTMPQDGAVIDDDATGTYNVWRHFADDTNITGDYYVWMAIRWVTSTDGPDNWEGPWRISGPDGNAGADGKGVEFIYRKTVNEQTPAQPTSSSQKNSLSPATTYQDDDWYPTGWTDNPQGVDSTNRFEWVCLRVGGTGNWSEFTPPVLWSVYGKTGTDGDGTEYIFCWGTTYPSDDPSGWVSTGSEFQQRDYIPSGSRATSANESGKWKDNPFDMEDKAAGSKQWVSIRKKYPDTEGGEAVWHAYSAPVLWNYAPRDGDAGVGVVGDLDNEMMAVGIDGDGLNYIYHEYAEVFMYNGVTPVTPTTVTITAVKLSDGTDKTTYYTATNNYVYVETNGTRRFVHVDLPAGVENLNSNNLDIYINIHASVTINESVESVDRPVLLRVLGVNFGADGASYRLSVGTPIIRINKAGVRTPSTISPLGIEVKGTVPQNPFTPRSPKSGFSFKYAVDDAAYPSTSLSQNTIPTNNVTNNLRVGLFYNSMLIDQETIYVLYDGDDNYRLDLDNENDSMLYVGNTLISGSATTTATLYKGADAVESTTETPVSYSIYEYAGCSASQASITSGGVLTVTGLSTSGYVVIQATYNGRSYYARFTLKKLVDTEKYMLDVTPSSIGYNLTTQQFSAESQIVISVRRGAATSNGTYEVTQVTSFPTSANESYAIRIDGTDLAQTWTGSYTLNVDVTKNKHLIQLVKYTGTSISSRVTTILDEETVPILKFSDGAQGIQGLPGPSGANGKDALPLRVRSWDQVYRGNSGDTPLTGDDRVFSGFEANAKYRDVILVSGTDYDGQAIGCPFVDENSNSIPTGVVINYSASYSTGWDGTTINLPAGSSALNYTDVIPTTQAESQALFDGNYDGHAYMWSVFMSFGAIFADMLVAVQGWFNTLTIESVGRSKILLQNGFIRVYDNNNVLRIELGQGENDSTPVLKFYDASGNELYNLGPGGIFNLSGPLMPPTWTRLKFYYSSTEFSAGSILSSNSQSEIYKYEDAYRVIGSVIQRLSPFNINNTISGTSVMHDKYFSQYLQAPTESSYTSYFATPGYYIIDHLLWNANGYGQVDSSYSPSGTYDTDEGYIVLGFQITSTGEVRSYEAKTRIYKASAGSDYQYSVRKFEH